MGFVEIDVFKVVLELQQVLIVEFCVPIGVSTIVWKELGRVVVINKGNEPELGSKACGVIWVSNRNWFLKEMGVVISYKQCFFSCCLADYRAIAHHLCLILVESFSWGIRSDVRPDVSDVSEECCGVGVGAKLVF